MNSTRINSYLTFNGNCREAMVFYKECLGGELVLQTVGESPLSEQMPDKMKENVVHSTLVNDKIILMGTDMVGEQGLVKGNAVSLMLNCVSEEEIKEFYKKLASGGKATHPLHDTYWGALFGDLIDKYGIHWLLNFDRTKTKEL